MKKELKNLIFAYFHISKGQSCDAASNCKTMAAIRLDL